MLRSALLWLRGGDRAGRAGSGCIGRAAPCPEELAAVLAAAALVGPGAAVAGAAGAACGKLLAAVAGPGAAAGCGKLLAGAALAAGAGVLARAGDEARDGPRDGARVAWGPMAPSPRGLSGQNSHSQFAASSTRNEFADLNSQVLHAARVNSPIHSQTQPAIRRELNSISSTHKADYL